MTNSRPGLQHEHPLLTGPAIRLSEGSRPAARFASVRRTVRSNYPLGQRCRRGCSCTRQADLNTQGWLGR